MPVNNGQPGAPGTKPSVLGSQKGKPVPQNGEKVNGTFGTAGSRNWVK